jgi:hypothetical protein
MQGPRTGAALRHAVTRRVFGALYPDAQARWRRVTRHPDWKSKKEFTDRFGHDVRHGPFQGLSYPPGFTAITSALIEKLLGAYELELHGVVEELVARDWRTIVNIGSSEGYYAVGLALRLPQARVYAYELDKRTRARCAAVAERNGASERVIHRPNCTVEELGGLLREPALVVCDCEGCELELLRPERADFSASTLLVELHDHVREGAGDEIVDRFLPTHDVRVIEAAGRNPADYSELQELGWSEAEQDLVLTEPRGIRARWAYATPREPVSEPRSH